MEEIKNTRTVDLIREYRSLIEILIANEGELSAELEEKLDELRNAQIVKSDNIARMIQSIRLEISMLEGAVNHHKELIDEYKKKIKSRLNAIDRLHEIVRWVVNEIGEKNASGNLFIKTNLHKYWIKKSQSVQVDAEELLPETFIKIVKKADKALIKTALKNGEKVSGASLIEKERIEIK